MIALVKSKINKIDELDARIQTLENNITFGESIDPVSVTSETNDLSDDEPMLMSMMNIDESNAVTDDGILDTDMSLSLDNLVLSEENQNESYSNNELENNNDDMLVNETAYQS